MRAAFSAELSGIDHLAPMPERVSFEEAASLVTGGGIACEGLVDRARLCADETVFVTVDGRRPRCQTLEAEDHPQRRRLSDNVGLLELAAPSKEIAILM